MNLSDSTRSRGSPLKRCLWKDLLEAIPCNKRAWRPVCELSDLLEMWSSRRIVDGVSMCKVALCEGCRYIKVGGSLRCCCVVVVLHHFVP